MMTVDGGMRIALIGPSPPFRGGVVHHTVMLARTLARRYETLYLGFSRQYPSWLFPGRGDRDPSRIPIQDGGVERRINSLNPLTWAAAVRRVRKFDPHTVVIPWWTVFWGPLDSFLAWRIKAVTRAELVFLCHNVCDHEGAAWKRVVAGAVLSRGDRFLVHGREDEVKLRGLVGEGRPIEQVTHPAQADLFDRGPDKVEAKRMLGLEGPVLLFFGFVRPYKGLPVLLRALPHIRRSVPATLVVAGEFWKDRQDILDLVKELGVEPWVRIEDRYVANEEVGAFFAASDLVVMPYVAATGGAVCQLALGHGRPVVASRVGGLSEAVPDGEFGRLVEPGNPEALAHAVLQCLEPAELERLTHGAAKAGARDDWERLALAVTGGGKGHGR